MTEFTGERVIPGLVDADLFNEHRARYRFAARFAAHFAARGARVLDAACGAGYGTAELGAVGIDISRDAIELARSLTTRLVQASCEALPFADASFDLITAFETIEHLHDPGAFLAGAQHALRPLGILLVSTPNRAWYAESRATAGPNPFHTREYDYDEFRSALKAVFRHVHLWMQNHAAAIVFVPDGECAADVLETVGAPEPTAAHFFLAACSMHPLPDPHTYAWIPNTGNVLREREQHIALLKAELEEKAHWLAGLHRNLAALQTAHASTEAELRERNLWAESLNTEIARAAETIATLQSEADARLTWVRQSEADLAAARRHIEDLDGTIVERTEWARSLESEMKQVEANAELRLDEAAAALAQAKKEHAEQLGLIAASRWVKLGRKLKVGPEIA